MKWIFIVMSVVALLVTVWGLKASPKIELPKDCDFDECVEFIMNNSAIPGLAVAKLVSGEIELVKTYGYANLESGQKVDENTLFHVASVSKPIMGISLLQLIDEGLIDLDEDINKYLSFQVKNPNFEDEIITLRHLASHTSGIKDNYDPNSFTANIDPNTTLKEHVSSLLSKSGAQYSEGFYYSRNKPGTTREYSNLAAALAGQLVESVTDTSLADYSKSHLLEPLILNQTVWMVADIVHKSVATPYEVVTCIPFIPVCANTENPTFNSFIYKNFSPSKEHTSFVPYPHWGNPQYPDGGIRSSISDLANLMRFIIKNEKANGEQLLSNAAYEEMFSNQVDPNISGGQRFFWRDNSMGLAGHMGADLGAFTAFYFSPESGNGFIILMNRGADTRGGVAMKQLAKMLTKD